MIRIRAEALDQAREMHGFSSDEKLAAALELSSTSVRNLRKGRSSPSISTLLRLRKLTGIPIEALLTEEPADRVA